MCLNLWSRLCLHKYNSINVVSNTSYKHAIDLLPHRDIANYIVQGQGPMGTKAILSRNFATPLYPLCSCPPSPSRRTPNPACWSPKVSESPMLLDTFIVPEIMSFIKLCCALKIDLLEDHHRHQTPQCLPDTFTVPEIRLWHLEEIDHGQPFRNRRNIRQTRVLKESRFCPES